MSEAQDILNMGSDLIREQFPETGPMYIVPPAAESLPFEVEAVVDMHSVGRSVVVGRNTRRTQDARVTVSKAANPALAAYLTAKGHSTIPESSWHFRFRGIEVAIRESYSDSTGWMFSIGGLQ